MGSTLTTPQTYPGGVGSNYRFYCYPDATIDTADVNTTIRNAFLYQQIMAHLKSLSENRANLTQEDFLTNLDQLIQVDFTEFNLVYSAELLEKLKQLEYEKELINQQLKEALISSHQTEVLQTQLNLTETQLAKFRQRDITVNNEIRTLERLVLYLIQELTARINDIRVSSDILKQVESTIVSLQQQLSITNSAFIHLESQVHQLQAEKQKLIDKLK